MIICYSIFVGNTLLQFQNKLRNKYQFTRKSGVGARVISLLSIYEVLHVLPRNSINYKVLRGHTSSECSLN